MAESKRSNTSYLGPVAPKPWVVYHLLGEGYVVAQADGLVIGMPQFYQTKEQALRRAEELNRMHGLRKEDLK